MPTKGELPCAGKADELAERHFGDVPLAVFDEAEEDLLDLQLEARSAQCRRRARRR